MSKALVSGTSHFGGASLNLAPVIYSILVKKEKSKCIPLFIYLKFNRKTGDKNAHMVASPNISAHFSFTKIKKAAFKDFVVFNYINF